MRKTVAQLRITFHLVEENGHQDIELEAHLLSRSMDGFGPTVAEAKSVAQPHELGQAVGMIAVELHPWAYTLLADAGLVVAEEAPALLKVGYVGSDAVWAMGPLWEAFEGTGAVSCVPPERLEDLAPDLDLVFLDVEDLDLLETLVERGYKVVIAARPPVKTEFHDGVVKRGAVECIPKISTEALKKTYLAWALSAAGLGPAPQE